MNTAALIEAILFVAVGPVEVGRIARTLEVGEAEVEAALGQLGADLEGRGLRLQRSGEQIQLVSAPEATAYVERFLGIEAPSKLSMAALETLAVVAYRQPITRSGVEAIRGVNSDRVLATLQARGLIEEVGRQETVGRPVLFGTTFAFLEYFGVGRLEDLPPLPEPSPLPPQLDTN